MAYVFDKYGNRIDGESTDGITDHSLLGSIAENIAVIATATVSEAQASGSASSGVTSSGTTAKATTGGANWAVTDCITVDANNTYRNIRIYNSGAVAGFFTFDTGTNWHYLPPLSSLVMDGITITNNKVQIQRLTDGGSDVTGVFVSIW